MSVLVRRALAADVPELARLEAACFTHPWTEGQIADEVAGVAPGIVLVLEGPGEGKGSGRAIRGYGCFRDVLDELHVMNVAIDPGFRRLGLARWLLSFAMARARRVGARRVLLEVRAGNREAVALYRSLGFREVGRRRGYYSSPPEDALLLSREDLDDLPRPRTAAPRGTAEP